ncbi:MAG: type III-B CRISPR module RAMP protein Cmr6 [Bacteroidetes bacterium]|nr:type III-B CRISPR module RAMP protein Cmr6 [Bacteroidota bacterium]
MAENWNSYTHGPNLGMLFYRRLYRQEEVIKKLQLKEGTRDSLEFDIKKDEKQTPFDPFYKALFSYRSGDYSVAGNPAATRRFSLFTTYPGLLVGTGYTHDSNSKGDAKIGFFFDHTSGLPVIPGSSVKGLLRSVFELDQDDHGHKLTGIESLNAIRFFLAGIGADENGIDENQLTDLKNEIFGDHEGGGADTFFDAVPDFEKTGNKPILGSDFITPHINHDNPELSPFTNPTPIQLIKILPGVAFEFRFKLDDSKKVPTWTAGFKENLFKTILLTIGIGAKTNVGYGRFTENYSGTGETISSSGHTDPGKAVIIPARPANDFPKGAIPFLVKNREYAGVVTDIEDDYYIIDFEVKGFACRFCKRKTDKLFLEKADKVRVLCANDYGNENNPNLSIKK